jgi:ubiquinone/menaquinone biosynthesis C-methylase UbiE
VDTGVGFTVPWLNLDPALLRQYAAGELEAVPRQLLDIYPACVLAGAEGANVLCLAAGGGQQSAVFSLLGARVTVFDLTEAQLAGDRVAAAHYGYTITTIQGDMRDLSELADASFDLVYQANSMSWIPDAQPVYSGVARILQPGGLYRVEFTNPQAEFADWDSWDGQGYRLGVPYAQKRVTERIAEDAPESVQFRHHMGEIFNGLLEAGLSIELVQDSPHYFRQDAGPAPSTWEHWLLYFGGFAILARKPDAPATAG